MTTRIAVVGAGALGGYVGGTLAHLGHDVTLIDAWPEHVETIRARGLELDGVTPEECFTVRKAKTMHLTEVQSLARTRVDIAFVAVKSYDTRWATELIAPYLSSRGYIVSLQNCLNERNQATSPTSTNRPVRGLRRTRLRGEFATDPLTLWRRRRYVWEPHGRTNWGGLHLCDALSSGQRSASSCSCSP